MYRLPSSIFVSNSSNGRGGGPLTTYPFLSKTPLWQGLRNCCRSAIQRTRQPRCVQIFDSAVYRCPSSVATYTPTSPSSTVQPLCRATLGLKSVGVPALIFDREPT